MFLTEDDNRVRVSAMLNTHGIWGQKNNENKSYMTKTSRIIHVGTNIANFTTNALIKDDNIARVSAMRNTQGIWGQKTMKT